MSEMEEAVRVERHKHFALVEEDIINDERLSWEHLEMLTRLLMSRNNPDWVIYKSEVMKHGKAGKTKFNRIWKELQACGYITKERVRDENGKYSTIKGVSKSGKPFEYGTIWTVHETPVEVETSELMASAEAPELKAEQDELINLYTKAANLVFEAEFNTIDSLEMLDDAGNDLLGDEGHQEMKNEFINELKDGADAEDVKQRFSEAWEFNQEHLVNPEYFATYLVNNMKNQYKIYRLELQKRQLEKMNQKDFYIPIDDPWNTPNNK